MKRWLLPLLVVILVAALGFGFGSKYQAEHHLPTLDTENTDTPAPPVQNDTVQTDGEEDADTEAEEENAHFHVVLTGAVDAGDLTVSEEHVAIMEEFMSAWYIPLAEFGAVDFADMFTEHEQSDSHADALRTLIAIRQAALTDLRMNSVDYTLTITSVEKEDGRLRIEADENTVMRFAATPDIDSILYDLPHIFIFDDSGETLQFHHHEADDNPYFSYRRAEDTDYDAEIERILRAIERRQLTQGEESIVTFDCDHPYDRDAALNYLYEYCGKRNSRWYAYDAVGGNCMNFGSQVLLAGGIPEDERGDEEWYWDGQNDLDLSWINVGRFYDYCHDNSGFGLVADTEAGYYTGEVGDVIIIGFEGDHRHTTIISDIVRDDSGNVVDYLISCNTTNYRDFPVSAYYYTFHRLVKIYGWNS